MDANDREEGRIYGGEEFSIMAGNLRTDWVFNSLPDIMPYYYIVLFGSIMLLAKYLFTEAAMWAKWVVALPMIWCFAGGLGMFRLGLAGLFLQVGLSAGIAFYLTYLKARG